MTKPIICDQMDLDQKHFREQSPKLSQLIRMLQLNRQNQEQLKKMRDVINSRMHGLQEFVSTYRLKTEFPPASGLMSYLKFQRNAPLSYRKQLKVIEEQEAIKNIGDDDCEFIKKLEDDNIPVPKRKAINFAELPKDPLMIKFQQLAQTAHYKTGLEVYRVWVDLNRQKQIKRAYSQKEFNVLIEVHKKYYDNWEKIIQYLQPRSFEEVYYQFNNHLNPSLTAGRWTVRQSLTLLVLVEHFGLKSWSKVSERMKIKSELQVRQRFCNILDPSIGKDIWTEEMEARLLEVASEYNYCWKDIAKLPNFAKKTDNSIWRKYRALMIKRPNEEIREMIRDDGKRRLADKIIMFKQIIQNRKDASRKRKSKSGSTLPLEEEKEEEMGEEQFFNQSLKSQLPLPFIQRDSSI